MLVVNGTTDVTTYFVLRDSTNHAPKTDVTITDIDLYYVEERAAISAKADATALAAADSAHGDNQAFHVGQGLYRIDWPDAAFDGGADKKVQLIVVCTGVDTTFLEVELSPLVSTTKSLLATQAELDKVPKSDGSVSWNATALAAIQSECNDALVAYDPPTNAELEARTLVAANYFDPATDAVTLANGAHGGAAASITLATPIVANTTQIEGGDATDALTAAATASTPTVTLANGAHGGAAATLALKSVTVTNSDGGGTAVGIVANGAGGTGLLVSGTGKDIDADITGSLSGAVGSVTATVTANTTQIEGGDATDAITAACTASTPTAAAVTGDVGGDVLGSVASIATGGIAALSFAAGAVNASALNADAVDEIFDEAIGDSTITVRQALKVMVAALAGKLSGAATATVTIRNVADDADRIVATVDADGNRSAVTLTV